VRSAQRFLAVLLLALGACLGQPNVTTQPKAPPRMPEANKGDAPTPAPSPAPAPEPQPQEAQPDLAPPVDMARPTPDLTGLLDCAGRAICDPSNQMCIRFLAGSPTAPGAATVLPSCYEPEPCPNGTLDCACIQNDPGLAPRCLGCVAGADGSFSCFASQ
jgi:hypothetical protein